MEVWRSWALKVINGYGINSESNKKIQYDLRTYKRYEKFYEIISPRADRRTAHRRQLQPVIFDSAKNEYRVVGEKVGTAWGSGKTIQEREVK